MADEKSGTLYDVVEHYLNSWAVPEIQQRKQDGRLPADFSVEHLQAVQVILNPEEQPRVKLDEEVRFQIVEDVAFGVTESGALDPTDVQRREQLELTDDDANAEHLTFIRRGGIWHFTFGFQRNAQRIRHFIEAAREFLMCATWAHEQGYSRAFVDNLFSAVELLAKALLLIKATDLEVMRASSHRFSAARLNLVRKEGRVPDAFVDLFNRLSNKRSQARYEPAPFTLDRSDADSMLATAKEALRTATGWARRPADPPGPKGK